MQVGSYDEDSYKPPSYAVFPPFTISESTLSKGLKDPFKSGFQTGLLTARSAWPAESGYLFFNHQNVKHVPHSCLYLTADLSECLFPISCREKASNF